jgi:hypothetical protein
MLAVLIATCNVVVDDSRGRERNHGDGKDLLAIRVLSHTLGKLA